MSAATFRCPCGASIEAESSELVALMNGHRCKDEGTAGQPAYRPPSWPGGGTWTGTISSGGAGGGGGVAVTSTAGGGGGGGQVVWFGKAS